MHALLGYGRFLHQVNLGAKGQISDADVMLGYQYITGRTRMSAYLGPAFHRRRLSPTAGKTARVGAKIQLEASLLRDSVVSIQGAGSYTEYPHIFYAYWFRGSLDWDLGAFSMGPEVVFFGDGWSSTSERRYGLSIAHIRFWGGSKLSCSVGARRSNTDPAPTRARGMYGNVSLSKTF